MRTFNEILMTTMLLKAYHGWDKPTELSFLCEEVLREVNK